ncbi:alpha/beta-hydrolase [Ramaria rubella]|nr:alpha/beta-hydrolase [Ramaria rubella]
MEAISKFTDTAISVIFQPTIDVFLPLLTAQKSQIAQTPKKTFKFGPTERHQVDVYYPVQGTVNAPIFFYVYGGGFQRGQRDSVPGVLYDNLGAFFAQRGILTAIADYRLAPETTYPDPVYDVRDAIEFTLSSPDVNVTGHGADKDNVYILGHSAGGAHVATLFLKEEIMGAQLRNSFKGAMFMAAAFEAFPRLIFYYGEPEEELAAKAPLGLLTSKSPDKVKNLLPPRLYLLVGENDVPGLIQSGVKFRKGLADKNFPESKIQEHTMVGHNHISPPLALFSGEGEEWGEEVVKWIKC